MLFVSEKKISSFVCWGRSLTNYPSMSCWCFGVLVFWCLAGVLFWSKGRIYPTCYSWLRYDSPFYLVQACLQILRSSLYLFIASTYQ